MVFPFNWFAFQSRKGGRNLVTSYDLNRKPDGLKENHDVNRDASSDSPVTQRFSAEKKILRITWFDLLLLWLKQNM